MASENMQPTKSKIVAGVLEILLLPLLFHDYRSV